MRQAESVGCHIITLTPDLLEKLAVSAGASKRCRSTPCGCSTGDAAASGYLRVNAGRT